MSAHALSLFFQFKLGLFPKSSPKPNECTHERSESASTLIHESQKFQKKSDGSYLMTSIQKFDFGLWGIPGGVVPLNYVKIFVCYISADIISRKLAP